MTQTNGSFWTIWSQFLYVLPTVFVTIAAIIVCMMNWQKAPLAAKFCLIGFCLIGFSAVFGAVTTGLLISYGIQTSTRGEILSILYILRIILSTAGFVFLLIAVFNGRQAQPKSSPLSTMSSNSP